MYILACCSSKWNSSLGIQLSCILIYYTYLQFWDLFLLALSIELWDNIWTVNFFIPFAKCFQSEKKILLAQIYTHHSASKRFYRWDPSDWAVRIYIFLITGCFWFNKWSILSLLLLLILTRKSLTQKIIWFCKKKYKYVPFCMGIGTA